MFSADARTETRTSVYPDSNKMNCAEGMIPLDRVVGYWRGEWVLALSGSVTLRRPAGQTILAPGDLAFCTEGPAGAHRLSNDGGDPVRVVLFSTKTIPSTVHYPDSGKWLLRNSEPQGTLLGALLTGAETGYWDAES